MRVRLWADDLTLTDTGRWSLPQPMSGDALMRILPRRCHDCDSDDGYYDRRRSLNLGVLSARVKCKSCDQGVVFPPQPDWWFAHGPTGVEAWQEHLRLVWRAAGIVEED